MKLQVTVTDQTAPSRSGKTLGQVIGLHVPGTPFPISGKVYVDPANKLKPGTYVATPGEFEFTGIKFSFTIRAEDLQPQS